MRHVVDPVPAIDPLEHEAELLELVARLCEGALLTDCPTLSRAAVLLMALFELGGANVAEAFGFCHALEAKHEALTALGSARRSVARSFADSGQPLTEWLLTLRVHPTTGKLVCLAEPTTEPC